MMRVRRTGVGAERLRALLEWRLKSGRSYKVRCQSNREWKR
jgi:hypothetical protein